MQRLVMAGGKYQFRSQRGDHGCLGESLSLLVVVLAHECCSEQSIFDRQIAMLITDLNL